MLPQWHNNFIHFTYSAGSSFRRGNMDSTFSAVYVPVGLSTSGIKAREDPFRNSEVDRLSSRIDSTLRRWKRVWIARQRRRTRQRRLVAWNVLELLGAERKAGNKVVREMKTQKKRSRSGNREIGSMGTMTGLCSFPNKRKYIFIKKYHNFIKTWLLCPVFQLEEILIW